MKNAFILLIILTLCTACTRVIQPGEYPKALDPEIRHEKFDLVFQPENIRVRCVSVKDQIRKDHPDDLIIYLHGMNRTEMEWLEKDGFGTEFYKTVRNNPDLPSFTAVSISIGGLYMLLEDAPDPYQADLETLFIRRIVPELKAKLNKNGNLYLIGHSLGGFNILSVTLRNSGLSPVCAVISPYTAPISPFQSAFDAKGDELQMPRSQTWMLKKLLTGAFSGREDKWFEYNPFRLLEKASPEKAPVYFLSVAENDLPGFEWAVDLFAEELKKRGFHYDYCKSPKEHWSVCPDLFRNFLKEIQNRK